VKNSTAKKQRRTPVFAKPTINDFLALADWHIAKAQDRAGRAVAEVRAKASAAGGFNSGGTVMFSVEAARKEFDACIDAVLGELKRVIRITDLDRKDLRDLAVQRLMQFASAAKVISQADQFRSANPGVSKYIDEQFTAFDQHLTFAVRQFDVGFFDPQEPEVPQVSNSITIGSMAGGAIQQGSPGANQSAQITVNVQTVADALTSFVAAIEGAGLPSNTMGELMADVHTIKAQPACQTISIEGDPAGSRKVTPECDRGNSRRDADAGHHGGKRGFVVRVGSGLNRGLPRPGAGHSTGGPRSAFRPRRTG
jgi:hypothetical protein